MGTLQVFDLNRLNTQSMLYRKREETVRSTHISTCGPPCQTAGIKEDCDLLWGHANALI